MYRWSVPLLLTVGFGCQSRSTQTVAVTVIQADLDIVQGDATGSDASNPPTDSFAADTAPPTVVVVEKVYLSNGHWNDYIKNDNATVDRFHQADVACSGNEPTNTCIHSGELLKVDAPNLSVCANATLTDQLGVFTWECRNEGNVVFYSSGFTPGFGLRNLVGSSDWLTNSVTIRVSGSIVAASTPSIWWNNPIVQLPDNSSGAVATLLGEGTIYVLPTSRTTSGYYIGDDRIALVTLPGATLSYNGDPAVNCNAYSGGTTSADKRCLISAQQPSFVWMEGTFDGDGGVNDAQLGIRFSNATAGFYNTLQNISVSGTSESGIHVNMHRGRSVNLLAAHNISTGFNISAVESSFEKLVAYANGYRGLDFIYFYDNRAVNLVAIRNGAEGVLISTAAGNQISDIAAFGNTTIGIYLSSSNSNVLQNLVSAENETGMLVYNGNNNTLSNVLISHNASGMLFNYTQNQTLLNITSCNNSAGGLEFQGSSNTVVNAIIAANYRGFTSYDLSSNNVVAQLVVAHNSTTGIWMNNVAGTHIFTQNILVGSNGTNCNLSAGTDPGITAGCANAGSSNANFILGTNLTSTLVGPIAQNDTVNVSDSNGQIAFANIDDSFDWNQFETNLRTWGPDDSNFPGSALGGCDSGTCRIWDWRLRSSATTLLNESGDGATTNSAFQSGAACPTAVHGDKTVSDKHARDHYSGINALEIIGDAVGDEDGICETSEKCFNRFLVNAVEIIEDAVGDNDALCESNEACIYSPNFGVYQGRGDYTADGTCVFQNGQVSNVTMYHYPINGE